MGLVKGSIGSLHYCCSSCSELHETILKAAFQLQEFLSKCKAPENAANETNLARGILPPQPYLTMPSKLPDLKEREGLVRTRPSLLLPSHIFCGNERPSWCKSNDGLHRID